MHSESALKQTWDEAAADPDLVADLGYTDSDVTMLQADADGRIMVLPGDDEFLQDPEFLVCDEEALIDVVERR